MAATAAIGFTWVALLFTIGTWGSPQKGSRTWYEKLCWPLARRRARKQLSPLRKEIARLHELHHQQPDGEVDPPLSDAALDFLQMHLHLNKATAFGSLLKLFSLMYLSLFASGALVQRLQRGEPSIWAYGLMPVALLVPPVITGLVIGLADRPGNRRWTLSPVATNLLAVHTLLKDPPAEANTRHSAAEPHQHFPYSPFEASPAQALENLAGSLEDYAHRRAIPLGRADLPRSNAAFVSAATHARNLADELITEGLNGRQGTRREITQLIEALTAHDYENLAPAYADIAQPTMRGNTNSGRRRFLLPLLTITAATTGLLYVLVPDVATAIAPVIASALLAAWLAIFRIPSQDPQESNRQGTE
nr:hypothetical protein OH820_15340 [Streptomyces sp. NBC_00857]